MRKNNITNKKKFPWQPEGKKIIHSHKIIHSQVCVFTCVKSEAKQAKLYFIGLIYMKRSDAKASINAI